MTGCKLLKCSLKNYKAVTEMEKGEGDGGQRDAEQRDSFLFAWMLLSLVLNVSEVGIL